jgi:hypothetical protein
MSDVEQDAKRTAYKKNPIYSEMSLRDYFAAKAMQGLYSDPEWRIDMDFSDTAYAAYNQADAMLKAREA